MYFEFEEMYENNFCIYAHKHTYRNMQRNKLAPCSSGIVL